MRRYELIVFDWDGTLMDSTAAIVHALQSAARDIGEPAPDEDRARRIIGLGLMEALREVMPGLAPARYGELVARYRHHYLSRDHELALFDGADALVESLVEEGYLLAVATGKSQVGLQRALAQSGLKPFFHATRCADQTHSKPHPAMLEELMEELGVVPRQALMVGDTTHDLLMAANAGVDAIAVLSGAHGIEVLAPLGPVACVDNVAEIRPWL